MELEPMPLTIQAGAILSGALTPPLPCHSYPRALCRFISEELDLFVWLPSTVDLIWHICTSLIYASARTHLHIRHLSLLHMKTPSPKCSQMFNLTLNEENIINIHKHPFLKEKCSTRWDLNTCISQSRQVPYYLEYWHHLFIGTLYTGSDLKTLTFVCNCHLQSTWFSASVHLSSAYLSECIHTWDICLFCTWRYLTLAKFSQMFHLILNEGNILNIHKHPFSNERCSTRWDLNPCLSQSRQVP